MSDPTTRRVIGVVSPGGVRASRLRDAKDWTLRFSLRPWRPESGALNDLELVVTKSVADAERAGIRDLVRPYDVLEVELATLPSPTVSPAKAVLLRVIGTRSDDAELRDAAAKLREPAYLEVAPLGRLVLDRISLDYRGLVSWGTQQIRLSLGKDTGSGEGAAAALAVTRTLWRDSEEWDRRLRDYAVQELLDLKNDSWLDEEEPPVSPEQFRRRMTLEAVSVAPDGEFTFTYGDGDLFGGHAIRVSGSLREGPRRADI